MRKVARSAIVPFTAQQMFELVDDVDAYATFLPWCHHSKVTLRNDQFVEATLELRKGDITKSFQTRNRRTPGKAIDLELLGGPFRHLEGGWQFDELGDAGSKASLALEFEFESRVLDAIFGAYFEATCNSLVDAFVDRAMSLYGDG